MSKIVGVHETAVRVLEEEGHRNPAPLVEHMREHVAYMDKLRADRLYLARSAMNYDEIIIANRAYHSEQVEKLEREVAELKEQVTTLKLVNVELEKG